MGMLMFGWWMHIGGCCLLSVVKYFTQSYSTHQEMSRLHNRETVKAPSLLNLFIHHQHGHRHMHSLLQSQHCWCHENLFQWLSNGLFSLSFSIVQCSLLWERLVIGSPVLTCIKSLKLKDQENSYTEMAKILIPFLSRTWSILVTTEENLRATFTLRIKL